MPLSTTSTRTSKNEVYEKVSERVELISKQMYRLGLFFQWFILQRIPVYYVPKSTGVAWTDGYAIYLGPKFLEFSTEDQLNIIRHELYHIAFGHIFQLKSKLRITRSVFEKNIVEIIHNIIADAVVNGIIDKENEKLNLEPLSGEYILPKHVDPILNQNTPKLGLGKAIDRLLFLVKKGEILVEAYTPRGDPVDLTSTPISEVTTKYGTIIVVFKNNVKGSSFKMVLHPDHSVSSTASGNQASGKIPGNQKKKGILVKKPAGWKIKKPEDVFRVVKEAREFSSYKNRFKGASSSGIGGTEYMLEDVAFKKPEWEAKLTQILSSFLSNHAVISWHFVNRRAPFIKPGTKYLTTPDMHILLDVSGSMLLGTSLNRALKRILYIAENTPNVKVKLYQWSTVATLPEDINRKFAENIRKYKKIQVRTGGTLIEPALDMVMKYLKPGDAVIIITDGYIFDIESESVKKKLEAITKKAGTVIFASLGYIPEKLPKRIHKIRLED